MILSKDSIINTVDYEIHRVEVPRWGGEVCLRPFTAKLKDKIEQLTQTPNPNISLRAIALAGSLCNENGELLFNDREIKSLEEKSAESVDIVLNKIFAINGITEEELEEKVKN